MMVTVVSTAGAALVVMVVSVAGAALTVVVMSTAEAALVVVVVVSMAGPRVECTQFSPGLAGSGLRPTVLIASVAKYCQVGKRGRVDSEERGQAHL